MLLWTPKSSPPRPRARRTSRAGGGGLAELVEPRHHHGPWGRGFLFTLTWSEHQHHVAMVDSPKIIPCAGQISRDRVSEEVLSIRPGQVADGVGNNLGQRGL